jgi:hypothetical protein
LYVCVLHNSHKPFFFLFFLVLSLAYP